MRWLGCWLFELVIFSVSCLSSWFVVSGWLVELVGVVVSLSKLSIFELGFELVGLVGLLVF